MNFISILYTTISTPEQADQIAETVVELGLAACVNIIPGATSVYSWEGKIEKSSECLMLFKTDSSNAEALQTWISQNHAYSVPALLKTYVQTSPEFYNYIQTTLMKK